MLPQLGRAQRWAFEAHAPACELMAVLKKHSRG